MRFEWDGSKAASNLKKHRVSFDEAVTVLPCSMIHWPPPSTIQIIRGTRFGLLRSATRPKADSWSFAMLNEAEPYA